MKTINSRRVREEKLLEQITKEITKAMRKLLRDSLSKDDGSFKDPVLPRK